MADLVHKMFMNIEWFIPFEGKFKDKNHATSYSKTIQLIKKIACLQPLHTCIHVVVPSGCNRKAFMLHLER